MSKERIVSRNAFVRNTTAEMLENRQVEFVISTETIDSHKTIFKMDGWDFNRYIKNPIVCYQHRSSSDNPDDIIGTSEIFVEDNKLIGRITFEPAKINKKAEKIFQKVQAGTLKMASVGARVEQARFGDETKGEDPKVLYFTRQQLIEWSIVSAGSNPDAHKRNAKTVEEIRNEIAAETNVDADEIVYTPRTKRSVLEAQVKLNKNKY